MVLCEGIVKVFAEFFDKSQRLSDVSFWWNNAIFYVKPIKKADEWFGLLLTYPI